MSTSPFEIGVDGATLRGEAAGFGIPVIFLHAEVTDRRMWTAQMEALAAEGYHVVSYDRRGHGETETPDEPFNHLIDLETLLDRLDIQAAVLVGSAMGGALAIDFAIENPDRTIGLVLVATDITGAEPSELPEEAADIEDALRYARERGSLETVNRLEAQLWLDGALGERGRVDDEVRELFHEMNRIVLNHPELSNEEEPEPAIDSLSLVKAPTLLVVGELDLPELHERHAVLAEEIESAFDIVLEDTAHFPSFERPDLFNPVLIEFLDALTGSDDVGEE